ncbi:MAG: hypothetical protein WBA57_01650 [Elainellaceae cyanobacterium]
MLNFKAIALLTALISLGLPVAAEAQSLRFPTESEQQSLIEEMRQTIPQLMESGMYSDRRTAIERDEAEAFSQAWAEVDPAVAPFLGEWYAIEESLAIYPSPHPGVVCIVDTYLDISDFYLGFVLNEKVYTSTHMTLVLDSDFLVSLGVYGDDQSPSHYEYAHPRIPQTPAASDYYVNMHPEIVEQFNRAGCRVGAPPDVDAASGLSL